MPAQVASILHSQKKLLSTTLFALFTALLLGYLISIFGNIQYGSNDGSLIINAAWPLHLGQTAYVDIVSGLPPLLLLSAKWSFDIFGVKWSSIVDMTALMAMVFFTLQTCVFIKNNIPPVFSILFSLYIQIVCWLPTSFLWHNGMTSASIALLFSSVWLLYNFPKERSNYYFFAVATFITLQTKPNLAGPSILFLFLFLFTFVDKQRREITICVLMSVISMLAFLITFNINPIRVLNMYRLFSNRVLQPENLMNFTFRYAAWEKLTSFALLIPSLIAFWLLSRNLKTQDMSIKIYTAEYLFGAISVIIAGIGIVTNNDFKIHELSPIMTSIFLIMLSKYQDATAIDLKPALVFSVSVLLFIAFGIGVSVSRLRIYEEEPGVFYQNVPLHEAQSSGLFEGVWAGPRFSEVLDELETLTVKYGFLNDPHASVFFGPRLDFAYALNGIEPRQGIPLWWEAFRDDVPQTREMVKYFQLQGYEYIVLLRCNPTRYACTERYNKPGMYTTFLPKMLMKYINYAYSYENWEELTIYHLRNR